MKASIKIDRNIGSFIMGAKCGEDEFNNFHLLFYADDSGEFSACYVDDGDVIVVTSPREIPRDILDRPVPRARYHSKSGNFDNSAKFLESIAATQVRMKIQEKRESVFVFITKDGLIYRTWNGLPDIADQVTNLEFVRRIRWVLGEAELK